MPAHLLIAHAQEALMLSVMLSLPVVLAAALVSYLVGAFQAASQIQDATIAHLPRLVVVVAALVIAGPWMAHELTRFASQIFQLAAH
jgi:type III secretory pathway component EscS